VLATVKLIMRRIIEQLKEQREKAKDTFIENSFIKRNCKIDAPCPDTDADLDAISELNQVISILENATMAKTQPVNCG
jgi:tRNA splicing ligase